MAFRLHGITIIVTMVFVTMVFASNKHICNDGFTGDKSNLSPSTSITHNLNLDDFRPIEESQLDDRLIVLLVNKLFPYDLYIEFIYRPGEQSLEFTIKNTVDPDEVDEGTPYRLYKGYELLDFMMSYLDRQNLNVTHIKAKWVSTRPLTTNYDMYFANIKSKLSPEDSAKNTWTGKQLARYGYTNITKLTVIKGRRINDQVLVTFSR